MSQPRKYDHPWVYEIRVKGRIDPQWSDWFDGFSIVAAADGETSLTGPVTDQAALHGLLAKIRDLGLPLLSLALREDCAPPPEGHMANDTLPKLPEVINEVHPNPTPQEGRNYHKSDGEKRK